MLHLLVFLVIFSSFYLPILLHQDPHNLPTYLRYLSNLRWIRKTPLVGHGFETTATASTPLYA